MSGQGEPIKILTFSAGSEEYIDVLCALCPTEAIGRCIDCSKDLCQSCSKIHKKEFPFRNHVIWPNLALSLFQKNRTTPNTSARATDTLTDRCPKHQEEPIKFYCNSHRTFCCRACIPLSHRSCKDEIYIRDFSNGVEMKKNEIDLQAIAARLTGTLGRAKWIKKAVDDSYSHIISDVSTLKNSITVLDQFENRIQERALKIREEKMQELNKTISICGAMLADTEEIIADIGKIKSVRHNQKLFISMKEADVNYKNKYERLLFKSDERLTVFLSHLTSLGPLPLVGQPAEVRAEYKHDINIKSDLDTEDCAITGIVVIPHGRLVFVDFNNRSVKLVEAQQRKLAEQIKLESKPMDLTLIKRDMVAVTMSDTQFIHVISVSPNLSKCYTIAVPGLYGGIEYFSDKLVLTTQSKSPIKGVHICDMSGVLLCQIETDYSGNKLFTLPSMLSLSTDKSIMYVTDYSEHKVMALTMRGTPISTYKHDSLNHPVGITTGDGGCVLVCSTIDNSIHQLSPDGQLVKILLNKRDGIRYPHTIAYHADTLYISSNCTTPGYRNNIRVYTLNPIACF